MFNNIIRKPIQRMMSSYCSEFLRYAEYGEPLDVLQKCSEPLAYPNENEVLIKMLVAPVNPSDINTIQGKYPDRPSLPAVPGNEGFAQVLEIGKGVKNLAIGDHVIAGISKTGTWRSQSVQPAELMIKVPKDMDLIAAAQLSVNPPTAYRMLRDFAKLGQCDTVIQNGSNSAVGQAVIQLCRIWGFRCVCVVRNRPEIDELTAFLRSLGATEVLTEEQVHTTTIFKDGLLRPKLALNCVGGKSATEILRHLGEKGHMVTYGAMSRQPVTAPNAALIFKDIRFSGFWVSRWTKCNLESEERLKMLHELIGWYADGQLIPPVHQLVPFDDWEIAVRDAINIKGFNGRKFILDFRK